MRGVGDGRIHDMALLGIAYLYFIALHCENDGFGVVCYHDIVVNR